LIFRFNNRIIYLDFVNQAQSFCITYSYLRFDFLLVGGRKNMSEKADGISMNTFIIGIVIAILASSAISTIIITQLGQVEAFGTPDYDSGWTSINPGTSVNVTHNLGTGNVQVYLYGRYKSNWEDMRWIYHQADFGTNIFWMDEEWVQRGVRWWSDENWIVVFREYTDESWEQFRVIIWKIP
jgi:hypothetical protein